MKVNFMGFSISCTSAITLNDFFEYLEKKKSTKYNLGTYDRLYFVNTTANDNYHVGLFVTVKDQKKFCELSKKDDKLEIIVNNIGKNRNLMDFNFFIVNKKNGLGIYQYYHNSCSTNQFCYFCNRIYNEINGKTQQKEISSYGGADITNKEKRKIEKKYSGTLKWELLVRKEGLPELMKELDKIKSFEFDFAYLQAKEHEFKPLEKFVKKERRKLSFVQKSPAQFITTEICSLADKLNIKTGRVFGQDVDGIERIIHIYDNLDNFGEYEYDDVAERLNALDMDKFEESWVTRELLSASESHNHIFKAKIK